MSGSGEPGTGPGAWSAALVEASPDGVVVVDASGRIVDTNPSLCVLSGYSREALVGQPVECLVPPADRDAHEALRREYRTAPRPRPLGEAAELSLRRKDGSSVAVEISLVPLAAEGAGWTAAIVRDVSRRVAADAERARLLHTLDLVPDAVLVTDASTLLVEYVNRAAAELTGRTPEQLVGGPVSVLRPEVDDRQRRRHIREMADATGPVRMTSHVVHGVTGEHIPVEVNRRLVTYPDGSFHLIAVGRDLRPRLEHEEALRKSAGAFRTALARAPIGVAIVRRSADGVESVVQANEAAAAMFGVTVAELDGRRLDELALPDEESGPRPGPAGADRHRIQRFRRADGAVVSAETRAAPIELPGVSGTLTLVHLLDVTEREAQQALLARRALLSTRLAEIATAVLAGKEEPVVLALVVGAARELLEGATAVLGVGHDLPEGDLRVEAVSGDLLRDLLHTRIKLDHDSTISTLGDTPAVVLPAPPPTASEPLASLLGPMAIARFGPEDGPLTGLLAVARTPGEQEFTDEDAAYLARLATQARLVLQLARARADQQRLALLEDRHRIARDLHDNVTQDLIALGLEISAEADRLTDAMARARAADRVERLEEVTRQLRRVVFELAPATVTSLGPGLARLAREAERVLGHAPAVRLDGPVEDVPPPVADDILRVAREALSNVARHAGATRTWLALEVDGGTLTLTVEDDGTGLPPAVRRGDGLANIAHRAEARGGRSRLEPGCHGGTRLVWSCPLTDPSG